MDSNIEFEYIETNGITLHVAVTGPKDGELVILLHGFPDFWYGWRSRLRCSLKQVTESLCPISAAIIRVINRKGKKRMSLTSLNRMLSV